MSKRFNIKNELEKLYFEIPKALAYEPKYKGNKAEGIKPLSNDAKFLYGILLDRTYLSMHTATEKGDTTYIDDNGDIFMYVELASIEEILNVGTKKAISVKKELIAFDLLEEVRVGQGKDNRLYLNIVETNKDNLKLYTSTFLNKVREKKKNEEKRIANLRKKKKAESVENTLYCQKGSTSTAQKEVLVLSKTQISNKELSNTDFSKPDFKKSDVDLFVLEEKAKKSLTYKIQMDTSMTIDEKVTELSKINNMNEHTKALVYKFTKYSILVSEAQIKMLNDCVYDVALESIDYTIAKGGRTFSYFYEVYKTKEKEDMDKLTNEFVFVPKFNPSFNTEKLFE